MFTSSGYDLSHVWVCCDQTARQEKEIAQSCLEQVRRSGLGEDSYVNASFSLGKLRQVCKRQQAGPDPSGRRVHDMIWHDMT